MNAANSPGTLSTHPRAASLMTSKASKPAASVCGRVDASRRRVSMESACCVSSPSSGVAGLPGQCLPLEGCSGGGMAGQPNGFRDLAQVIVGEMVPVAA